MKYSAYIKTLSKQQLAEYAERVGTSVDYLTIQLLPRRRIPRPKLMMKLADSSSPPCVKRIDVLEHFYPEMFEAQQ